MSGYKARVVNLSYCTLDGCEYGPEQHLVVETKFVTLERGNAIAISYTWGDIARKRRKIGHYTDGSIATLTLGDDWRDEEDLLKADNFDCLERIYTQPTNLEDSGRFIDLSRVLQGICAKQGTAVVSSRPGYIWIDQLSIIQDTEEVKVTLARIPDIYRCFDVVVLFPGAVCDCIKEEAEFSLNQSVQKDDHGLCGNMSACGNSPSYGSWFTRLWPRQELFYAQHIESRWTSENTQTCPSRFSSDVPIFSRMSGAARLRTMPHVVRTVAKGPEIPLEKYADPWLSYICSVSSSLVRSVITSFAYWTHWSETWIKAGSSGSDRGKPYMVDIARFLTGTPFERKSLIEDTSETTRVVLFCYGLQHLVFEERSTTQRRDFVLAIWPDCPRYTIPDNHQELDFASLLEDAILQLERNWGVLFVNTLPSGLFTPSSKMARLLWRPSKGMFAATKRSHDELILDGVGEGPTQSASFYPYLSLQLLQVADPITTADIYGTVSDPLMHYDARGLFKPSMVSTCAIISLGKGTTSPTTIRSFDEVFFQRPTKAIFDLLRVLVPTLPYRTALLRMSKLSRSVFDWNLGKEEQFLCQGYFSAWVEILTMGILGNSDSPNERRYGEVKEGTKDDADELGDPYARIASVEKTGLCMGRLLTMQLVCAVMGADPSSMEQAGFSLMVDIGQNGRLQPRIGLSKFPQGNTMSTPTYTVVPVKHGFRGLAVGADTTGDGALQDGAFGVQCFEVTCEGPEKLSKGTVVSEYEVVGVWLPQVQVSWDLVDFITPLAGSNVEQ